MNRPLSQDLLAAAAAAGDGAEPYERMLRVAMAYARLSIPVLPLWHRLFDGSCACSDPSHVPGGEGERNIAKHPRCKKGLAEATTDRRQIQTWWTDWPAAGIALATGVLMDVIDVDNSDAMGVVADLIAAGRMAQPLATGVSGRDGGGYHFVVPASGAGNASRGLPAGVDYRGRGGYIVAAPTLHRSGRSYVWRPVALPSGDADGGSLAPVLPWECLPLVDVSDGLGRRRGWALERLNAQATKVQLASKRSRNDAVWDAGIALGACVAAEWIGVSDVHDRILSAADATDRAHAQDTLTRALAAGRKHPLPQLAERTITPTGDVIDVIERWIANGAGRKAIGGRAWPSAEAVLRWLLAKAERSGHLVVVAATRDVEAGTAVSRAAVSSALHRLSAAGVVTCVEAGSRRARTAAVYRLQVPEGFVARADTALAKRQATYGGVSTLATKSGSGSPALDLWFRKRGVGHGLTQTDRMLLLALPGNGDAVRTSDWATAAGVHRTTASKAGRRVGQGSLADLDLVIAAGRGRVAATQFGGRVIAELRGAAVMGHHDATASLGAALEVNGRAQRRDQRIAEERARHGLGLLPRVLVRHVRGTAGLRRDHGLLVTWLPEVRMAELLRLLHRREQATGGRRFRSVAATAVGEAVAGRVLTTRHLALLAALVGQAPVTPKDVLSRESLSVPDDIKALASVVGAVICPRVEPLVDGRTGEALVDVRLIQETVAAELRLWPLPSIAQVTAVLPPRGARQETPPACPGYRLVSARRP